MSMTANQILKALQDYLNKYPEVGDKPLRVLRNNGKRTYRRHEVEAVGCGSMFDGFAAHITTTDLDGEPY